jgi:uncharacterized protein YheU (UPF0270 family)
VLEELNIKSFDASLVDKQPSRTDTIFSFPGNQQVVNVYLDLEMTPELLMKGLARELERQIQDLRKKSGLKIGEIVDVYYNTQDEDLEKVITSLIDRQKTFVGQVSKSLEVEVDFEHQAEVGGKPIWLGLIKA